MFKKKNDEDATKKNEQFHNLGKELEDLKRDLKQTSKKSYEIIINLKEKIQLDSGVLEKQTKKNEANIENETKKMKKFEIYLNNSKIKIGNVGTK